MRCPYSECECLLSEVQLYSSVSVLYMYHFTEDAVSLNEVFSSDVIRPLTNDETVVSEVHVKCL